ncbi:U32 family peptidase [Desulfoluna sp.]|uniref:peptidase U32 family protein n=1 Tax=Desulfoluna sp. TaxID=2045199 RepID=UPI00263534B3|nr:U32 family peptidase [Desulfoluna sp.]
MTNRVELLAPAGNPEKLEIAVHYGADAVYLAGKTFSLRNFSGNFTLEEMRQGIRHAHAHGVKVYVACNVYARNDELGAMREYLAALVEVKPDALIIADPAIFAAARELAPDIDLHISTQANTTNWGTARFWKELGASRINVARELPLTEIKEVVAHGNLDVEAFIHGAMCISYSGRCLLSSFLTNRDSNRGQCSHPCRWKYSVVEEMRPGHYHPLQEDERGSYIFNSKDLCMIEHIPALVDSGIASLKIEGRMKGINYLASVVKTYREAIDAYYEDPEHYVTRPEWVEELSRINSREYATGFYFGYEGDTTPNYKDTRPGTIHRFAGKIIKVEGPCVTLQVRNKIITGQEIEVLTRQGAAQCDTIGSITDLKGAPQEVAQPNTCVTVTLTGHYAPNDLIRIAEESTYGQGPEASRLPGSGGKGQG